MTKNVLIIDDQAVVRRGVQVLLQGSDFVVGAEAETLQDATTAIEDKPIDCVLMETWIDRADGLKMMAKLKTQFPDIPFVIYSASDNPTYIARAYALGASGYVLKRDSQESLVSSLAMACDGQQAWHERMLSKVTGGLEIDRIRENFKVSLTARESEVLRQVAYGLSNREIAASLKIGYDTVKEHVQNILRKTGSSDRTRAAVWVVRNGLL